MNAEEAIRRYIPDGSVIGLGGQNINRCPMSLVHEIVRQEPHDLTVVGCNLSLPLDILAAAGLVTRTEQGSGNLEKYGVLFTWRRLVESGQITAVDHSHLGMASRFLAGSLGLPFLPTRSLLGSSVLEGLEAHGIAVLHRDPWEDVPIVLMRTLTPDVSIIHASRADEAGNVSIDGVTSHEIDMIKASKHSIISVEEIVPGTTLTDEAESVTISCAFVDALVVQPFGAWPTSLYRRYDYHEPEIVDYQSLARRGADAVEAYLDHEIRGVASFDEYLSRRDPVGELRNMAERSMRSLT